MFKYYRVFKNQTAVTEISVNDFKPVLFTQFKRGRPLNATQTDATSALYFSYHLPQDDEMYYGYRDKGTAMRKAKAGAMAHIELLLNEIIQGIKKLKEYRAAHYEDLNLTLLDGNIRKMERELNIK